MGVPKFYRWISERYPCLSEVVKEYQIPEFDNLYLDMNGIIHVCSHPEDDNPHFRITEEKIFESIFHYIEVLFRMIKPRKVFFMAVDGVAPRAKMNQQRGRRFRSAREAENLVKKALEKGEVLPTEARFDSNCITPGTEFMDKLNTHLKYFVVKKISTDRLWQGVRVYLSGHETPGEGEHKVMDFIRNEKSNPNYDPNTRHCLYGLDADLMMLGLTTHEPHFSLLREEVRFGKQNQKRSSTVEETTFHLLHLSLMREYIDFEFSDIKDKLSFEYDLERIIDDWVLMGFLVGNDFIPHLPDLHIHHNALPLLWKTYKKVLPNLTGYLNDGGTLNLPNFEVFMRRLSKFDVDNFKQKHADIVWFNSRRKEKNSGMPDALTSEDTGIPTANEFMSLRDDASGDEEEMFPTSLQSDMEMLALEMDFTEEEEREDYEDYEEAEDTDPNSFYAEFQKFKAGYYRDKLEYTKVTQAVLQEQCYEYVRAIQWILHYYFNGVQSWSWFYPFHYAPYLSDVRNFSDFKLEYDYSYPFLPYQQLMAVLPSASKNLIPLPLQTLMVDETSPVKDFYPVDFTTDLNGKQQEWEAVVQIPFIEEKRLLASMKPLEGKMTDEEKARNKHGPHNLFVYSATPQGTYSSTLYPDLYNHNAVLTDIKLDEFWLAPRCVKKGLCDGVKQDVYFPGFPTLKHLPHTAQLKMVGVKVFQHVSKSDNMVLTLQNSRDCDHEEKAEELIGKSVFVGWPHLMEARVNAISDGETKFFGVEVHSHKSKTHKLEVRSEDLDQDQAKIWGREVESIREHYLSRKGVEIGETYLLLYASLLSGRRYVCGSNGRVTLDKQWANSSQAFVLQGTVKDIAVKDPSYHDYSTLGDLFPTKADVFMLGQPHYGAMGEVLSVDSKNDGRIRVDFSVQEEPYLAKIQQHRQNLSMQYFPGYNMARRLGISTYVISRITGSLFINRGKRNDKAQPERGNRVNIGLNLKFNKTSMEVPGYTKKTLDEWTYSYKLQQVIEEYITEFPEVFEFIARNQDESSYYEGSIFAGRDHTVADVTNFLKKLPTANVQPVPFGSDVLDEQITEKIQMEVNVVKENNRKKKKRIKMQVRPHLLFRPLEAQLTLTPDPSTTYELFDRIVNVRDGFSVPLGLRGTVIGITNAEKEEDVLYDVLFDEDFLGGLLIRCSTNCAYRMPKTAMINLSHGERKAQGKSPNKPTAVVKPQASAWGTNQGTEQNHRGGHNRATNRDGNHSNRQDGSYSNRQDGSRPGGANRQQNVTYNSRQQQDSNRHSNASHGNHGNRQQSWQSQQVQQVQLQAAQNASSQSGRSPRAQNKGYQNNNRGPNDHQAMGHQGNINTTSDTQGDFAEIWHQLQESFAKSHGHEASNSVSAKSYNPPPPPPSVPQPHTNKPSHTHHHGNMHHGNAPSLQDAAIALQVSQLDGDNKQNDSRTKQPREGQGQQGMKKIDLDQFFTMPDPTKPTSKKSKKKPASSTAEPDPFSNQAEFNAFFSALQVGGDKPEMAPQADQHVGESTAALCQMLNINPGDSSHGNQSEAGPQSQPPEGGSGAVKYGKQLSVQELFGDQSEQNTNVKIQDRDQQAQDVNKQRSAECNLADFCRSVNLAPPTFSCQRTKDDRHRAVVRLGPSHVFTGSYAKSEAQARESAAGVALLQLTKGQMFQGPGFPPRGPPMNQFGPPPAHFGGPPFPGQGGPPPGGRYPSQSQQHQGPPPRLSASPNSAFTPVRQHMGPNMPSMPPFPAWGSKCPPFPPPPPHFGPPQQQRYPPRGQGHHPQHQGQGHFDLMPPGGFQSPPKPQRDRNSGRNQYPQEVWSGNVQGQGHHGHQQGQGQGQHVYQHGHQQGHHHQNPQQPRPAQESHQKHAKSDATTPKKANPFVPLQVMQKQKTPQKDTRKEGSSTRQEGSSSPEAPQHTTDTHNMAIDHSQPPLYQGPSRVPSEPHHNKTPSSVKKSSSESSREKSVPKSGPPARRPKSRIAARFDAM